jgi:hypothetical protein
VTAVSTTNALMRLTIRLVYTTTDSAQLDFSTATIRIIHESFWASLDLSVQATTDIIETEAQIVRCLPTTTEDTVKSLVELTRPSSEGTIKDSGCERMLTHMLTVHSDTGTENQVPLSCAWHLASRLGEAESACTCLESIARVVMRTGPVCLWRLRNIVRNAAAGDVGDCVWAIRIDAMQ